MNPYTQEQYRKPLPSARGIRRACAKELYRTVKRLKLWVPQDKLESAETLYCERVKANLLWIHENGSNRKALCDWWDREVGPDIAALWGIDAQRLCRAFRESFGG
ncbi:dehydrogenase [Paenibacillus thermoaerophilus]|nr:dehydrogenase [Paenibacillus thermoaerophilus]TMV16206.1 dehydrogenase [Paenibacillus thermoaerophilus]